MKFHFEQVPLEVVKRVAVPEELGVSSAVCAICGDQVQLEHSKTNEHGRPVHEKCYVANLRRSRR